MQNLAFLALAAAGIVKKRPRGTLDVPGVSRERFSVGCPWACFTTPFGNLKPNKKKKAFSIPQIENQSKSCFFGARRGRDREKAPARHIGCTRGCPGSPGTPPVPGAVLALAAARIVKKHPRGTLDVPGVSRERF